MLLTAKQAAERLGIRPPKFRQMAEAKQIPAIDTARKGSSKHTWQIEDKALKEWQAGRMLVAVVPPPNGTPTPPPAVATPVSGLASEIRAVAREVAEIHGKINQLLALWG